MKVMITGATGHLGSNLVQRMLDDGHQVLAVARNHQNIKDSGLDQTGAEVVHADLTKPGALDTTMPGVDVLFQCAANFSHWSRNTQHDIIERNNNITNCVLASAHRTGIKRLIYVSSTGTLKRATNNESIGPEDWGTDSHGNPYFESKMQSERLAWRMAENLGLSMISLLPSAMIGGKISRETPTTRFIHSIYQGKVPLDLDFELNLVSIDDVCQAMSRCIDHGEPGRRYILANTCGISVRRIAELCMRYNPKLSRPKKVGRRALLAVAGLAELISALTRTEPELLRSQVRFYFGSTEDYDIRRSQQDLDFNPQSTIDALDGFVSHFHSQQERNHV